MLRITDLDNFPPTRAAVTIGNFDGCHLGHRSLVDAARAQAAELRAAAVAVTFDPRPDVFFREPGTPDAFLFTEAQKSRALAELGIDIHYVQKFDERFASLSPAAFYDRIARDGLAAAALVVGYDFRFGRKREGDLAFLRARGERDGVRVVVGEAAQYAGRPISSTRVRAALRDDGDVEAAAAMLGRPYVLEGEIRRGDQLGRTLGVPTANLEGVMQLVPKFGVYAGWVAFGGDAPMTRLAAGAIPAVFALGIRPTLGSEKAPPLRIEAHLLSGKYGADEHYGVRAAYYLTHRLRDELKFGSLDELKVWMAKDIAEAKVKLGVG